MPLLQTFRSFFLRVPSPTPDATPTHATERRWPPPPRAETLRIAPPVEVQTGGAADWDTLRTGPPAGCDDSISDAEPTTFDRDIVETGPRLRAEMTPSAGPWREDEPWVHDDTPRSWSTVAPVVRRALSNTPDSALRPYQVAATPTRAVFVDHSAAAGAMWPDDEDQAAVSHRGPTIAKTQNTRGDTVVVPISRRRARVNPLSLTAELRVVRFSY